MKKPQNFPKDGAYFTDVERNALIVSCAIVVRPSDLTRDNVYFWAFMFHRNRFAHGPNPAGFVALNLFIGLSCALPAYLYAQELGRKSA